MNDFEHPFGEVVPGESVVSHGPVLDDGFRPRRRMMRDASNKWIYTDALDREKAEMTTAMATTPDAALIERVLIHGDLRQLTPAQKVNYYKLVCESVGLNPLTQPFQYLVLNGKEILYATRAATEQLRQVHSVSVQIMAREVVEGMYVVTARATLASGRQDENIGAVPIMGLKGESLANAMMKAETKAKRRVTLAICGLGMLDETEVQSIQAETHTASSYPASTSGHLLTTSVLTPGANQNATDGLGNKFPATDDGPDLGTADDEQERERDWPPGFRLIDDYKLDGDWHQVTWGRDAKGGWAIFKTKLAKIGLEAHNAFTERVPVLLHSKKPPYLDKVERLS